MNYNKLDEYYSYDEIPELVESRLLSNGYGCFSFYKYNRYTGNITLKCEKCKEHIVTTMDKIEEGTLPIICPSCKKIEINKQLEHQKHISEIISEYNLELIRIENQNYEIEDYIIRCKNCGKEYFLNQDFYLDSEPYEMCCKNWDCMMNILQKNNHFFAKKINDGTINILENCYSEENFLMDYEDWIDNLQYQDIVYTELCKKCGTITLKTFENVYDDCDACYYNNNANFNITKWDKVNKKAYVRCANCNTEYFITEEQAYEEVFACYECFRIRNKYQTVCPICQTHQDKQSRFCETCGYCLDMLAKNQLSNQKDYTEWLSNAVYPAIAMWNTINSKIKLLEQDLDCKKQEISSLKKETLQINQLKQLLAKLLNS